MATHKLNTPLTEEQLKPLKAGDTALISGFIYTARDAAHKRLCELVEKGEDLPFDIKGQIIYFVGPTPAKPGKVIGSAGPTTAYRMDDYSPTLLDLGLKGMIGKGGRSDEVITCMKKNKAVYFGAIGGAAALISDSVNDMELIAYEDLLSESIKKMTVKDFPCIVVNDLEGNDAYKMGQEKWRRD